MRSFYFLIFLVISVVTSDDPAESEENEDGAPSTLRFVTAIFRHGIRSPVLIYPTNPVKVDQWEQETLSWLTVKGAQGEHALGKYMGERYEGFYNKSYLHSELRAWSSDVYRTIMSAKEVIDGLYDDNISKWQPVPVSTVGKKDEDDLIHISKPCPRKDDLISYAFTNSTLAKEMNAKYEAEFRQLEEITKLPSISYRYTAFLVVDCLKCQEAEGLGLPEWYTGSVKTALDEINDLTFKSWIDGDELKRLSGGPLLKHLIETLNMSKNGTDETKIHLYSGHDTTLAALLAAMGIFDDRRPGFSSAVFLELHETAPGEFAVQVLYKHDSASEAVPVTHSIKGCPSDMCPFDTFEEGTKDGVPEDWAKECETTSGGIEKRSIREPERKKMLTLTDLL